MAAALVCQMKAGPFPDRLIPNIFKYILCTYGYSAVILLQCGVIQHNHFLAVKQCAFMTMHGGSAVVPVCTFLEYGISGFLYGVISLYFFKSTSNEKCKDRTFQYFCSLKCDFYCTCI